MDGMPTEGTALPRVGDEVAGKYRIESVLGQGGMGAVFAARNKLTGKRVAIKWLLPEHAGSTTRERLLREAQIAASIEHPNVVDIYDVGEHDGGLFLVMEYLRGKPLSDVLEEVGRMDADPLIALLVPAMRGVHAAHLAGVVHRDLKPDNIILHERDGKVVPKVVDFGVSKTVGSSAMPASTLTRTGALVGTPHYMAIEQIDGSKNIDSRTDVYAFGVLLYRALTGMFPHDGATLGEVILKIGTQEVASPRSLRPDMPAALDQVILRALSRDRTKRYNDLEELARVLAPFTHVRPGDPIELSLLPRAVQSKVKTGERSEPGALALPTPPIELSRRRTRVALLAAVVAAAVLVAGVAWMSKSTAKPVATKLSPPVVTQAAALAPAALAAEPLPSGVPAPLPSGVPAPPPSGVPEPLPSGLPEPVAEPVSPPIADRPRHARRERTREPKSSPVVPVSKLPRLIPGERTNGLSADDF